MHIDFSFWGFTIDDCNNLNVGLSENHSILGIHMLGNQCGIDSKGYFSRSIIPPTQSTLHSKVVSTLHAGEVDSKNLDLQKWANWWIWEGWIPITFKYEHSKSNCAHLRFNSEDEILLHLSIDDYHPEIMIPNSTNSNEYIKTRMVPPNQVKYYFSVNGMSRYLIDGDTVNITENELK